MRFAMNTLGIIFVFAGIAIGIAEWYIYGFSLAIVLGNFLLIVIGVLTLLWAEQVVDDVKFPDTYNSDGHKCNCKSCRMGRGLLNG